MADREGGLVGALNVVFDTPDRRRDGGVVQDTTAYFSLTDKRRAGSTSLFQKTTYYRLRARDNGQASPPLYRIWVSTNANSAPPSPSPIGSWVETVVLDSWDA